MAAGHAVSPGIFKSKDAEPEATLELFSDYCENMERVFRLRRRIHPTTGARINFDDAEKKDLIMVEGGEDMQKLFKYTGKVLDTDTYQEAVDKIKAALKKRGNRTSAVFKLFNGHAQGSQSFESWHTEVYKAAQLIDWTDYDAKKAAVDAIIMQTSSVKLQQKAIQENPTYEELVDLGISQEQAKKKSTKFPEGDSETVNRLKTENKRLKEKIKTGSGGGRPKCPKCCSARCKGGSECFAEGKKCNKCTGLSHFAASKLCPKNKKETTRRVSDAEDSGTEESGEEVHRIMTQTEVVNRMEDKEVKESIFCRLKVTSHDDDKFEARIKLATDTGVRKTILNRSDWFKIRDKCLLVKTKLKFRPYGTDHRLPIRGRAKVRLQAKAGACITTYVFVNDSDKDSSLLGKADAIRLGIIKINLKGESEEVDPNGAEENVQRIKSMRLSDMQKEDSDTSKGTAKDKDMEILTKEYEDIFHGIGKYEGPEVKIRLKENVRPVIQPPRRIPLHYVQPLADHMKELIAEDVVEGPLTEEEEGTWISNLVITDKKWDEEKKKEGERIQIRANLDCRPLNNYVYQTHEPIPTTEELRHRLKGSTLFSTFDMVHSFHQFVLEEEARKLFTFRAPGGLYRYKRLVMGNSPASSEAHRRIKMVLEGCEGCVQIKDDVLVYGDGETHDRRLRAVLERFRAAGLTLRKEKCKLAQTQVVWFGMVYTKHGMSEDPEKTAAIRNWPAPKTMRDVKSFLQTCQFNSVYMTAEEPGEMNYSELTAPLRDLTKRKTKFVWTARHQQHFQLIKDRMCSDRVMVPFDLKRETRLYSDGGPEGAQATVAQRYEHETEGVQWRPVTSTSRAWTDTEKRYSQIEKESNALLTGIVSNRMYLLGNHFTAVVDHKPLVPLYSSLKRPKQMRVDRHRMKLAAYDFEVTHIAGDKMPCDYGSRAGCPKQRTYTEQEREDLGVEDDMDIYVNRVIAEQLPPAVTREMLKKATGEDKILRMLTEDIQRGVCRNALSRYQHVFPELSVIDGMIVRGEQLVIPEDLQVAVVQLAHEGHLGYDKTIGTLRESVWFPGMGKMVREYVESCVACQAADPRTEQEPLKPSVLPDRPWQYIHADFKGPIMQKYYLHTFIDQYTKYPVVEICTSTSWEQMEPMMEMALGTFGNIEKVTTDGGPPYDSKEFRRMARRMGFEHHICTPENPQANGFVEVFQKVLVKMIHTAVVEKQDPRKVLHRYLASYRAAPHKTTGKSPYEMMFNRKMMTKLPRLPSKVNQDLDQEVREKHDAGKMKQKLYADEKRKAKDKKVEIGDKIMVKQKKSTLKTPWDPEPFKVVGVEGSRVTAERGDQRKVRAKNNIKVVKERPVQLRFKREKKVKKMEEELDLDVDLDKIRVLSRPEPSLVLDREEGQADDRAEEEEDQEEISDEGEKLQELRPVRVRRPPRRYSPDQAEKQGQRKERLSPRDRRRAQSRAKFRKGEEPLRTKMRIKERWEVREKGAETVEEEN